MSYASLAKLACCFATGWQAPHCICAQNTVPRSKLLSSQLRDVQYAQLQHARTVPKLDLPRLTQQVLVAGGLRWLVTIQYVLLQRSGLHLSILCHPEVMRNTRKPRVTLTSATTLHITLPKPRTEGSDHKTQGSLQQQDFVINIICCFVILSVLTRSG